MNTPTRTLARPYCRWMIRRDVPEVMAIETASFPQAWSEDELLACLRQRKCIGMVATNRLGHVTGFMVYELRKDSLHLLNFAVAPWARREGVGAAMVAKLVNKLSTHRRSHLTALVREGNLPAQLFFKACGFEAADVWRGYYADTHEDGYLFEFHLPTPEDVEDYR